VTVLLAAVAGHELEETVGAAWVRQTEGNPFFIQELLRHLIEEGSLYQRPDGRWTTTKPLVELGVPQRIREVVARRVARLSQAATQLLQAAAAFDGTFRFDVAASMAELSELDALDALDEALAAHLLVPAGAEETYAFVRTLIRQTVYAQFSPSRQIRLHRRAAEALDAASGTRPSPARSAEIAAQYHRSRALPGAERGVEHALTAALHAQTTGGYDEAATLLHMALDLLPENDERHPRLLGRLGIVLAWALSFDEAVATSAEAGQAIAEAEGKRAAAEYLSDAAYVCASAGGIVSSWDLARTGLTYAGARDVSWARVTCFDYQRREAEHPEYRGIPLDTADRAEAAQILRGAHLDPFGPAPMEAVFASREEALTSQNVIIHFYWCGEYARSLPLLEAEADHALSGGQFARSARCRAFAAMCHAALGSLDDARLAFDQTQALGARMGIPVPAALQAREGLAIATDAGLDELAAVLAPLTASGIPPIAWLLGGLYAWSGRIAARLGRSEEALRCLALLAPWLERAPAWTIGFPVMASHAAETLWVLERDQHLDVIERALRDKVIAPDFRSTGADGRLAMARLCGLSRRYEEAVSWFADARRTLTAQGARPLLAIADYDEALMYARRNEPGDMERAGPLVETAKAQFETVGMTGWIARAQELAGRLA
ncbi:MAG: hypothetical protein LC792_18800, partial [Actinobacteria bacterium]|nr:hypothetical protein [Actinomycetota bacterium]